MLSARYGRFSEPPEESKPRASLLRLPPPPAQAHGSLLPLFRLERRGPPTMSYRHSPRSIPPTTTTITPSSFILLKVRPELAPPLPLVALARLGPDFLHLLSRLQICEQPPSSGPSWSWLYPSGLRSRSRQHLCKEAPLDGPRCPFRRHCFLHHHGAYLEHTSW